MNELLRAIQKLCPNAEAVTESEAFGGSDEQKEIRRNVPAAKKAYMRLVQLQAKNADEKRIESARKDYSMILKLSGYSY